MRLRLVTAAVAAAFAIGHALASSPEASADVSAECWAHLASVQTHNTSPAADRRYHLERGEPSPCTEYDAEQGSGNNDGQRNDNDGPNRHRYDSPGYHCKLTWTGYHCG